MASSWLRRAGPEDAALLSRLKIATFRASYRGVLPDDLLAGLGPDDPHVGIEAWRNTLLDRATEVHLVEAGEPAGFVVLKPAGPAEAPARGLLEQIYLLPGWQGLGWGKNLWRFAARRFAATERLPFAVCVLDGNDRARRLYEQLGGTLIGLRHDFEWRGRPIYERVYLVEELRPCDG
jgi:ribosomal protein S18 acetylase RimI-like enzyme